MKLTKTQLKKFQLTSDMHVPVNVTMNNKKTAGFKSKLFVLKDSEVIGLEAKIEDVKDIFEVMGYGKSEISVDKYVIVANAIISGAFSGID